jgi:hypothetical protein
VTVSPFELTAWVAERDLDDAGMKATASTSIIASGTTKATTWTVVPAGGSDLGRRG